MDTRANWRTLAQIACAMFAAAYLLVSIVSSIGDIPPASGTIVAKGHHPAWYGGGQAPEAYFLAIQSEQAPNTVHTWYVSEDVYARFEVGNKIDKFGRHGR